MGESVVHVKSASELKTALSSYSGDTTVVLQEGDYGSVVIANSKKSGALTLTGSDPDNPPTLTLSISGSHDVRLDGLALEPTGGKYSSALSVSNSSNVTVVDCSFEGVNSNFSDSARGISVVGSTNVVIDDNSFEGLTRGVVVSHSKFITLTDNDISNMRSEGFNFMAVSDVEIAGNFATDFSPAKGDHPDFIQFFTNGAGTGSKNINIHDNVFMQGDGGPVQGILMGNNSHIPYENVSITNNVINSSMPHGISLYTADGVNISNNVAVSVASSSYKVAMMLYGVDDVVFQSNIADAFNFNSVNFTTQSNNLITAGIGKGAASAGTSVPPPSSDPQQPQPATTSVDGTTGNDNVTAKSTSDLIDTKQGNDIIRANGGNDTLIGGDGDDQLNGGPGVDEFLFYGDQISSTDTDKIYDLDFSGGDSLTFVRFGHGIFVDPTGGLGLGVTEGGSAVVVKSFAELAELVRGSDNVTATRKGSTDVLILTIKDLDGDVQQVHVSNSYSAYVAALSTTPPSTGTGTTPPPDTGPGPTDPTPNPLPQDPNATLSGTDSANDISGKGANEIIDTGRGDDTIRAGGGNDILIGGEGNDMLHGGGGADQFRFYGNDISGTDFDKILDLNFADGDSLVFDKFATNFFGDVSGHDSVAITDNGQGAVIDSFADIKDLVDGSNGRVIAGQKGSTDVLKLTLDGSTGVTEIIEISNAWSQYVDASRA